MSSEGISCLAKPSHLCRQSGGEPITSMEFHFPPVQLRMSLCSPFLFTILWINIRARNSPCFLFVITTLAIAINFLEVGTHVPFTIADCRLSAGVARSDTQDPACLSRSGTSSSIQSPVIWGRREERNKWWVAVFFFRGTWYVLRVYRSCSRLSLFVSIYLSMRGKNNY